MACLHFIGGEKGGVGKSVMSRLIAQYCIDRGIPFVGYDTDASHGTFARFYADYAAPVVIGSFASLDQVVETLCADPSRHALVDLAAQTLRPLREWSEASGMAELLAEQGHRAVFWHVMDDSVDALSTLGALCEAFGPTVSYVIVLNHGRGSSFAHVDASPQLAAARRLGAEVITLQRLHETSMHKIDLANASFWAAINRGESGAALGMLERQRVKVWLRRVYQDLEPIVRPPA
jgi:hypothetical protein